MLPASSAAVRFLPFPLSAGVDSTPALRLCHVRSVRGPVVSASLLALARFISPLRIACAIRWGCSLLLLIVRVVSSRVAFDTSLCLQGLVVRASLSLCVFASVGGEVCSGVVSMPRPHVFLSTVGVRFLLACAGPPTARGEAGCRRLSHRHCQTMYRHAGRRARSFEHNSSWGSGCRVMFITRFGTSGRNSNLV